MPRPKNHVPTYRLHRQSGLAVVTVNANGTRKDVTLGKFGSPESQEAYRRVLADLAAGRLAADATGPTADVTVNELCLQFWRFAEQHYRTPEGPTDELRNIKHAINPARELYGHTPAREFGPLAFKRVRDAMIAKGWSRPFVNAQAGRLKRVVRFGVENELIPADRWEALRAVRGLAKGRCDAPEPDPVGPVADAVVDATLPHLNRHVRGLVEFQRLTGCRPGEAVRLRRADVDASGAVWVYRPPHHKNSHHGVARAIAVGPKAQALIAGFPTASDAGYVFSPRAATAEHHAARTAGRKTPSYASHMRRNAGKRTSSPRRSPKERYATAAYNRSVRRACVRAGIPVWCVNQLRHTFGTEVRRRFDLEAAQVVLGHARADTTQIYAEKNLALAAKVAAEIG